MVRESLCHAWADLFGKAIKCTRIGFTHIKISPISPLPTRGGPCIPSSRKNKQIKSIPSPELEDYLSAPGKGAVAGSLWVCHSKKAEAEDNRCRKCSL